MSEALLNLVRTGNWERVLAEVARQLEEDPDQSYVHFIGGLAACELDQRPRAEAHLNYLMEHAPDWGDTHYLAALVARARGRERKALKHILEALEIDPDEARFHYFAAATYAGLLQDKKAQEHAKEARRLDPNDADYAHLDIVLNEYSDDSVRRTQDRVEELQAALRLEPENTTIRHSIGEAYLEGLEDPRTAEQWFREGLALAPHDPELQQGLFTAVGQRNLLYRVLSLPLRSTRAAITALWVILKNKPWYLLFFVVAWKFAIAYGLWLVVGLVLLTPAALAYEWLVMEEFREPSRAGALRWSLWHKIQRWPLGVRFGAFLVALTGVWTGIFAWTPIPVQSGMGFIAAWIATHMLFIGLLMMIRRFRHRRYLKRRAARD